MKTFRIYGKKLNTWFIEDEKGRPILRQVELQYKEYSECGELIGAGSEDFGFIAINKRDSKIVKEYLSNKYKSTLLQLR